MALASYISNQPVDEETLDKVREESDKDLQAERARELPLVQEARELAEDLGLLKNSEDPQAESTEEDPLTQALGKTALTPEKPARVTNTEDFVWLNPKLRYNPKNRHTTPAQKKEIRRRDGWCSTPGCPNQVWLHLHHLKPYSKSGKTERKNLLCLCAGCHRNHHKGELRISATPTGKLLFTNKDGHRLDFQTSLERAGWLDYWLGWAGEEANSHTARLYSKPWDAELAV